MNTKQPIIQSPLNKTRADKWIFLFNMPQPLMRLNKTTLNISKESVNKNSVQFALSKIKIPDITIKAISQRYASGNVYVSSHSKEPFPLLTFSFEINGDYTNYITLYNWLNLIHDEKLAIPDPNNLISKQDYFSLESYWTNVSAIGLDEYNKPKIQFIFSEAFPTSLNGFSYDYSQTGPIECSCAFAFAQMYTKIPDDKLII